MLKTKLLAPAVAAAAFGGYAVYNYDMESGGPNATGPVSTEQTEAAIRLAAQPPAPPVFHEMNDYREFLRFDVYPNWVKSRWPRVSTVPFEAGLSGMRVAVVTGVGPTDLSGSLTYYFDDTHRVQKIQFVGTTNDSSRLVNLFTQKFDFKTHKSLDAGFYIAGRTGNPRGILKLGHPVTIQSGRPDQIMVYFEILAPQSEFRLSGKSLYAIRREMSVNR